MDGGIEIVAKCGNFEPYSAGFADGVSKTKADIVKVINECKTEKEIIDRICEFVGK